jgi:hypothetical protein
MIQHRPTTYTIDLIPLADGQSNVILIDETDDNIDIVIPHTWQDITKLSIADIKLALHHEWSISTINTLRDTISKYMRALPILSRIHGGHNDELQYIVACLLSMLRGLNTYLNDRPDIEFNVDTNGRIDVNLRVYDIVMRNTSYTFLLVWDNMCRSNSIWSTLSSNRVLTYKADNDPVELINDIMYSNSLIESVELVYTLKSNQLNILQQFFNNVTM